MKPVPEIEGMSYCLLIRLQIAGVIATHFCDICLRHRHSMTSENEYPIHRAYILHRIMLCILINKCPEIKNYFTKIINCFKIEFYVVLV